MKDIEKGDPLEFIIAYSRGGKLETGVPLGSRLGGSFVPNARSFELWGFDRANGILL